MEKKFRGNFFQKKFLSKKNFPKEKKKKKKKWNET